jgi:hypothetical protein
VEASPFIQGSFKGHPRIKRSHTDPVAPGSFPANEGNKVRVGSLDPRMTFKRTLYVEVAFGDGRKKPTMKRARREMPRRKTVN